MTDAIHGTQLGQDVDKAFAAYRRHYGLPRAMEKLRLMLVQGFEEQMRLDSDGSHDNWKRIGDLAREAVDAIQPPARKAAE
jgi:hypothetical protein